MKINYNGHELEGSVEEIVELMGKRKYNKRNKAKRKAGKKRMRLTKVMKKYIIKAKEQKKTYSDLAQRFNKKFGTDYNENDMQMAYYRLK